MKYVRMKSGEINIMEDSASIPAGSETIFSTEPAVYEGTWDKGVKDMEGWEGSKSFKSDVFKKHGDVIMKGEKMEVQDKSYPGDIPRDTSYIGTKEERKKTGYDPEKKLREDKAKIGWKGVHKPHPTDKVCLNCGKVMKDVRPNRKFCSDRCRKDYSQKSRRASAKAIKTFRPHMGKEGQIYYIHEGQISFVPGLFADNEKRAIKYVSERYKGKTLEDVIKQIKEVMKK
jgi:predicted nucleic acid-binding Zn ribbon protein